jgi:hypothetical protein
MNEAKDEPVAFICDFYADSGHPFVSFESVTHGTNTPLYTTSPQRKPLTDEEIMRWWASENGLEDCDMAKLVDFTMVVRAVEAAHGITGDKT